MSRSEGEITLYGLRIDYSIDLGEPGHYGSGVDLHDSYPDDDPEVHIEGVEMVDRLAWLQTIADFDLEPDQDTREFLTEVVWDDLESSILSREGLS